MRAAYDSADWAYDAPLLGYDGRAYVASGICHTVTVDGEDRTARVDAEDRTVAITCGGVMQSQWLKDPDAVLPWVWDWSAWLETGETIETFTVTIDGDVVANPTTHDDTTVTVWLSGGTVGQRNRVTCHVDTSQGRSDDRTIRISIQER